MNELYLSKAKEILEEWEGDVLELDYKLSNREIPKHDNADAKMKIELWFGLQSTLQYIAAFKQEIVEIERISDIRADEIEELQGKERRAWEYARFFSGRSELLRLHVRTHLGLSQKDCIGWGEHDYRDALLTTEEQEDGR